MKIERRFTTERGGAYGGIAFTTTASEIRNPDGQIVFRNEAVEVPEGWSQVASDVIAQKYFRKAGVPARLKRVKEKGVPEFLWRSVADEAAQAVQVVGVMAPERPGDRLQPLEVGLVGVGLAEAEGTVVRAHLDDRP